MESVNIRYNRIADWLRRRQKISADWRKDLQKLRESIKSGLQHLPQVDELRSVSKKPLYDECRRIRDVVVASEGGGFLGLNASETVILWRRIVKTYEDNNLHLADSAEQLAQWVTYDIPALQNAIKSDTQKLEQADRKEAEIKASASQAADRFKSACEDIRIQGSHIRQELLELRASLPQELSKVAIALQSEDVGNAVAYYHSFVTFMTEGGADTTTMVPMVAFIRRHGNATVYQYETGEVPDQPSSTPSSLPEIAVEATGDGSDTVHACADEEALEIDFGDMSIDFGDFDVGDIDVEVLGNADGPTLTIDFGDNTPSTTHEEDGVVSASNTTNATTSPKHTTVLASATTRHATVNELMELEAFLIQRGKELSVENQDVLSINQFSAAPEFVQKQTCDSVQKMVSAVRTALSALTSERVQQLIFIDSSERYVDRLTATLTQQRQLETKQLAKLDDLAFSRKSTLWRMDANATKISQLKESVVQLKTSIEHHISQVLGATQVSIVGGIDRLNIKQ